MYKEKIVTTFLLIFAFINKIYGQNIERIVVNTEDNVSGYYLALRPHSGIIKGVLVLFPGYGQPPESIFTESKLHNVAYANDLLVIAVASGNKLYADSTVVTKLNLALHHAIKNFEVNPEKFVIGGYSAGGTVALRYAELCKEFPNSYPIKPQAVFTVDSPVDLIESYHYFEREITRNYSAPGVAEAKFAVKVLQDEIGTPDSNPDLYKKLTPFYKDLKEPGNERYLRNLGVRVYHDIDISWYLKERRRSAFDENFLHSSELINRLLLMGNTKAEFIQAGQKGIRSNGVRHPHSWNIVDEPECIQWIKDQLEIFNPITYKAPFHLPIPENYSTELMPFPIEFAKSITYQGVEALRFSPGWGNPKSQEYWTYAFLWYLENTPSTKQETIHNNLQAYFDGLVKRNLEPRNIAPDKVFPTKVRLVQSKTLAGDLATYQGTVEMLDYMEQKPIILNCKIHVRNNKNDNKTLMFYKFSPQSQEHPVWKTLDGIWEKYSD